MSGGDRPAAGTSPGGNHDTAVGSIQLIPVLTHGASLPVPRAADGAGGADASGAPAAAAVEAGHSATPAPAPIPSLLDTNSATPPPPPLLKDEEAPTPLARTPSSAKSTPPSDAGTNLARQARSPAVQSSPRRKRVPWCLRRCCGQACGGCCCGCTPICSVIFVLLVFIVVLFTVSGGYAKERRRVRQLPFVTYGDSVCGATNTTFPNASAAHAAGDLVRHCGDCGQCSTAGDIATLDATVGTITRDGSYCAVRGAFLGVDSGRDCFVDLVNFSTGCAQCWVDNILCDIENCVFTCLLYRMGIGGGENTKNGELSPCIECDEKVCGPAFKQCAGAYRRSAGMLSEIQRPEDQLCRVVDVGPGAVSNTNDDDDNYNFNVSSSGAGGGRRVLASGRGSDPDVAAVARRSGRRRGAVTGFA